MLDARALKAIKSNEGSQLEVWVSGLIDLELGGLVVPSQVSRVRFRVSGSREVSGNDAKLAHGPLCPLCAPLPEDDVGVLPLDGGCTVLHSPKVWGAAVDVSVDKSSGNRSPHS